jgi:ferredoxin-NADP reductase
MKKYLNLVVQEKTPLEGDVYQLILSDPTGNLLPSFGPGAHIEVKTPHGLYRHYSLIGAGNAPLTYELGIKRMANGRGGSMEMVDELLVGQEIQVSLPENFFALEKADEYLFIAGGIGITPIADRSHDILGASDQAIVTFRRLMHAAAKATGEGKTVFDHSTSTISLDQLKAWEEVVDKGTNWRILGAAPEEIQELQT